MNKQSESLQSQRSLNDSNECKNQSDPLWLTLDEGERLETHEYCDWQPVDLERLRALGAL